MMYNMRPTFHASCQGLGRRVRWSWTKCFDDFLTIGFVILHNINISKITDFILFIKRELNLNSLPFNEAPSVPETFFVELQKHRMLFLHNIWRLNNIGTNIHWYQRTLVPTYLLLRNIFWWIVEGIVKATFLPRTYFTLFSTMFTITSLSTESCSTPLPSRRSVVRTSMSYSPNMK